MSKSFLDEVVSEVRKTLGDSLEDMCFVVPSRRAGLYLKKSLTRAYARTIWAPAIFSIQDFVRSLSESNFPEPLTLIFELYEVYMEVMHKTEPGYEESFEQFYAWGELLLADFDEIDKYLVDAQQLYRNVKDLKEIEARFGMPEESVAAIQQFWESLQAPNGHEIQEKFLKTWEILFDVYRNYRYTLAAKGLAYDGMAYRHLAEQDKTELPYKKLIFLGFNAFTKSEFTLIERFLENGLAHIYWDVDVMYFSLPDREAAPLPAPIDAGKFIQAYHRKWEHLPSKLIVHDMTASPKDIYLCGVPLQAGQTAYLGELLQRQHLAGEDLTEKYAIVPADENLLLPTLYALPPSVKEFNITMGLPLRNTYIYHLLNSILVLFKTLRKDTSGYVFAFREVADVLSNPYIQELMPEKKADILRYINHNNLVFIPRQLFTEWELPPIVQHIFTPPETVPQFIQYFAGVFEMLEQGSDADKVLEREYILRYASRFNLLQDILGRYQTELSLLAFSRLLREAFKSVRIPFVGDPLQGIQIMGFLETRCLDFEQVYLLSANEGKLPDTPSQNSFVPYNLRKGFGLPTLEDKDSIVSYHFYRLLQRCSTAHIIYNSSLKEDGNVGEVSRFVRQLRFYLRDLHNLPNIRIHDVQIGLATPYTPPSPILVRKDEKIQTLLEQKYFSRSSRYISATALTTYLACPLRFYFKYILQLKEPEGVEENMEAGTLGSILHSTLEYIYKEFEGRMVDSKRLQEIRNQLKPYLKKAFAANQTDWEQAQGMNFLMRDVLERLCGKILNQDLESEPFSILFLEEEHLFETSLNLGDHTVKLNGKFDRVDRIEATGRIRIIDYKTGRVDLKKSAVMEEIFASDDYKELFQGYFYAWLFNKKYPDQEVSMGFYPVKKLGSGLEMLQQGEAISSEILREYEDRLISLLHRIFSNDYSQVEDWEVCGYCAYREICNR